IEHIVSREVLDPDQDFAGQLAEAGRELAVGRLRDRFNLADAWSLPRRPIEASAFAFHGPLLPRWEGVSERDVNFPLRSYSGHVFNLVTAGGPRLRGQPAARRHARGRSRGWRY